MDRLDYEYFINYSMIYGLKNCGCILKNTSGYCDPANLSHADNFSDYNFIKAKIAFSYIAEIYIRELTEHFGVESSLAKELENFENKITYIDNFEEFKKEVNYFYDNIFSKYYKLSHGIISKNFLEA